MVLLALLAAPAGFAIGTLGAGIVTLRSDRTLGARIMLAGAGLGIFAGCTLFALAITTIEGGNPPYQAIVEPFALLAAALAMAAGAIGTALSLIGAHPHNGVSPRPSMNGAPPRPFPSAPKVVCLSRCR